MNKIILAFSGGLDTSFCVPYLIEQGYEVVTATINTGGFEEQELKRIEEKAIKIGSSKHYNVNAQKDIYEKVIQYIIKLNGFYEGDYPIMCADRYVIAEKILEIAEKEGAKFVSHGSTANGNDQVRFDSTFLTLGKGISIISPIKDLNISRDDEIKYLEKKGIEVDKSNKKYSINENVFGCTFSGSEIDENKEPDFGTYKMTKKTNDNSYEYISIGFESGIPVSLNGVKMNGLQIIRKLNKLIGKYGYGRKIYTGDCIIGIKGRIMFEAPGLFTVIEGHKKLEQVTLTKKQLNFNNLASQNWADLVYSGLYYDPLVSNLEKFADASQKKVTGIVKIKAESNKIEVVEIKSQNSLINLDIATYAQGGSWTAKEADGFIKLHTLQQKISQ